MKELMQGELIVSCQALANEPLHSPYIMSKMALAAKLGGAKGIRANSIVDIQAIKKETKMPIIGIVKQDYEDSEIFITPTMQEIKALVKEGVSVIALDATLRKRPNNVDLDTFFKEIKETYPEQKWMADCSTVQEALYADQLGFDYIGTTLVGYTTQSKNTKIETNDFAIIKEIVKQAIHPVIAEGNIDTPKKARRVLELGCYSVVVGSIITRPQYITEKFTSEIKR